MLQEKEEFHLQSGKQFKPILAESMHELNATLTIADILNQTNQTTTLL